MASDKISAGNNGVRGHITLWQVDEKTGARVLLAEQPNQIQYTWGYIAAKQFGFRPQADRYNYNISAIYIEYENQSDPESTVSVPSTFERDLDITYYNSLASSSNGDFIRVPLLVEPTITVSAGYEENLPVDQQGNQLNFFAQTAGVTGANGKTFGSNVNSKVFAAALVAAPVFGDRTKDVIFARTVFSAGNQVTKESSSQIGITWSIAFE